MLNYLRVYFGIYPSVQNAKFSYKPSALVQPQIMTEVSNFTDRFRHSLLKASSLRRQTPKPSWPDETKNIDSLLKSTLFESSKPHCNLSLHHRNLALFYLQVRSSFFLATSDWKSSSWTRTNVVEVEVATPCSRHFLLLNLRLLKCFFLAIRFSILSCFSVVICLQLLFSRLFLKLWFSEQYFKTSFTVPWEQLIFSVFIWLSKSLIA